MKKVALQDLLMEEQEPFHLTSYINERRCQIKKTARDDGSSRSCFGRKSPLALFGAARKTSPAALVLKVPPTMAALLLESALKIQKPAPTKTKFKASWIGIVGSLIKKVISKNNKRKELCEQRSSEEEAHDVKAQPLDSLSFTSPTHVTLESGRFEDDDDFKFYDDEYRFCESPFRFVLLKSPPNSRSTEFSSPTASPCRSSEDPSDERETEKCSLHGDEMASTSIMEEGEKEQCSPVSVLDPPFDDEQDDDRDYDLECSYANVQRSRNMLLRKLRKFEKLAGLSPVALDKHMLEDDDDSVRSVSSLEVEEEEVRKVINDFLVEEFKVMKVPGDIRRLIEDVIDEEQKDAKVLYDAASMAERICKRLASWQTVKDETNEMMVVMEMEWDNKGWQGLGGFMENASLVMEFDIFGVLLDELSLDLLESPYNFFV